VTAVTVKTWNSGSESLLSTGTEMAASSSTVAVSFTTTGGSGTGVMVIETVAVSVPPWPSETVYSNVTVPRKPCAGVNTR